VTGQAEKAEMLTSEALKGPKRADKARSAVLTSRPEGGVLISCLAKPGGVLLHRYRGGYGAARVEQGYLVPG
jgi:hypothetical protein